MTDSGFHLFRVQLVEQLREPTLLVGQGLAIFVGVYREIHVITPEPHIGVEILAFRQLGCQIEEIAQY